jgi:glycosyltransferase involved in cell wall biosynthesis
MGPQTRVGSSAPFTARSRLGDRKPIRALHVLGGMNPGGVETWLLNVLRHRPLGSFDIDILAHTSGPCAYDNEVRALGAEILTCGQPRRPWTYAGRLHALLRERRYDVVHSHVHHFSGFVLRIASAAGVPIRVAHSHLDTTTVDAASAGLRRGYLRLMTRWIRQYATSCVASSREAAVALFGSAWVSDPRCQILYCGIDLTPFKIDAAAAPPSVANIEKRGPIIGHVGRFDEQKNHQFLIRVAAEVIRREPTSTVLLVGDGPLRSAVERQVQQVGIAEHVRFVGLRSDVPQILRRDVDVFVLPSLYEGLPLVGIEAQAAGVPSVISDAITTELDIVPGLIHRRALSESASVWAETILATYRQRRVEQASQALAAVERSAFNIDASISHLGRIYAVPN